MLASSSSFSSVLVPLDCRDQLFRGFQVNVEPVKVDGFVSSEWSFSGLGPFFSQVLTEDKTSFIVFSKVVVDLVCVYLVNRRVNCC